MITSCKLTWELRRAADSCLERGTCRLLVTYMLERRGGLRSMRKLENLVKYGRKYFLEYFGNHSPLVDRQHGMEGFVSECKGLQQPSCI